MSSIPSGRSIPWIGYLLIGEDCLLHSKASEMSIGVASIVFLLLCLVLTLSFVLTQLSGSFLEIVSHSGLWKFNWSPWDDVQDGVHDQNGFQGVQFWKWPQMYLTILHMPIPVPIWSGTSTVLADNEKGVADYVRRALLYKAHNERYWQFCPSKLSKFPNADIDFACQENWLLNFLGSGFE